MFRLSKMTDYGVVVLGCLAGQRGRLVSAPDIAEATGLPGATVSQVLKTLAAAGVVASHRGARGGYELARAPEAVTVRELVVAFEGPLAVTACVDGAADNCAVESLCLLAGGWEQVNAAIRTALDSVTLADVLRPITHFGRPEAPIEQEAPL
ncbi:MAG: SUF system Fe-S cluster assembly regulator [Alphaproteobacteria bacterium]|nr:SUF system Fe-S cluster assembly regulator [Alphaproteobacteria bacterium]MCB9930981.1 SUF system Fe-S cluster assembly regulator [Alphaproteobacteria bacterium]